jgi:hypothetical protein
LWTRFLTYPQRKMSNGIMSGDWGPLHWSSISQKNSYPGNLVLSEHGEVPHLSGKPKPCLDVLEAVPLARFLACQYLSPVTAFRKNERPIDVDHWQHTKHIYLCAISDMLDCVLWLFYASSYCKVFVNFNKWKVTSSLNTDLWRILSADVLLKKWQQNVYLFTLSFSWIGCTNGNL